jgi:hypothetical protein
MIDSGIHEIANFKIGQPIGAAEQTELTAALENGKAVTMPGAGFPILPAEAALLDPRILAKAKNVSYNPANGNLGGTSCTGEEAEVLRQFIARYSKLAGELVVSLFPCYAGKMRLLRTSFRPAEIAGRKSSWRKDDTRLHVDAFPSQPTNGNRILRVFCNVNPVGKPRVWRLGEPFEDVARRFLPNIGRPFPGSAVVLKTLGITKSLRSEYDFIMLKLHDAMKADDAYQASVGQTPVLFAPGTIWACYADSVSHAAISGQHQFEQTVSIPLAAMQDPGRSPLRILERLRGRTLA